MPGALPEPVKNQFTNQYIVFINFEEHHILGNRTYMGLGVSLRGKRPGMLSKTVRFYKNYKLLLAVTGDFSPRFSLLVDFLRHSHNDNTASGSLQNT
jgi:hypothetical protein